MSASKIPVIVEFNDSHVHIKGDMTAKHPEQANSNVTLRDLGDCMRLFITGYGGKFGFTLDHGDSDDENLCVDRKLRARATSEDFVNALKNMITGTGDLQANFTNVEFTVRRVD
jgi:hypothetical protein